MSIHLDTLSELIQLRKLAEAVIAYGDGNEEACRTARRILLSDPLQLTIQFTSSDTPKIPVKERQCYAFPCQSGYCEILGLPCAKKGGAK